MRILPSAVNRLCGPFHVDHVLASDPTRRSDRAGESGACVWALQSAQGPNIAGRDPVTGEIVPLFHPIKDQWRDHFEWNGPDLIGRTTVGRVTIHVLGINDLIRRDVRAALLREGSFDWD